MPSRRVLAIVLAFLLVLFGGDRLLAQLLRHWVETSSQVHAELYTGRGTPADVVFAGSSRSREHFPIDWLEQRTERRMVNLGWGGLSSDQAAAVFLDHVQRYGPPPILVLEVTSPEVDDVMIRNLRLFEHDSARIRKLVAETEPVLYHTGRLFELLRYNNKLFFDIVRYDFNKEDYLTDAVIDRDTLAEIRAEMSIDWEYRQEDIEATADLVRTAGDMGVTVVPLITPMLPDYLERLDGFEEWRRRLGDALPADVALRDYSAVITDIASFRDDLHLNRRGVRQLMSRLRRDRVPGFTSMQAIRERSSSLPVLGASSYIASVKRKSELERLTEAVRQAEAELDAAVRLSDVKAAGKRLQRVRAELRGAGGSPTSQRSPRAIP